MSEQNNQIDVPDRLDDEAPATAEQLQFIRQLVAGMSLQGFRFDYRKLGNEQAASVIDQMLALRGAAGTPLPSKTRRPGCITSFIRGITRLAAAAIFFGALGYGGYYVVYKTDLLKSDDTTNTTASQDPQISPNPTPGNPSNPDDGLVDSMLFDGLKVAPRSQDDDTPTTDPPPEPAPQPTTPTPEPDLPSAPKIDAALFKQVYAIDELLEKLSGYTEKDYSLSVRTPSVNGMKKLLADLKPAMQVIEDEDASLPQRINAVIQQYAEPEVDGQAIRQEIETIRIQLKAIRDRISGKS